MAIIRTAPQNTLAIWGEVTAGTRPSPVTKAGTLPLISHNLGRTQTIGKSRVLRGDINPAQPPRGRFHMDGDKLVVPIERAAIGLLLFKMFPNYAVAGSPYVHTFKMKPGAVHTDGLSCGFESWDTEAAKGEVVDGCAIVGVEGDIDTTDTEAGLTFTVAGMGKGNFGTASREQATPAAYTDAFWNMADARILIDTAQSDFAVSGKFSIQRQVSVRYIPNGDRFAKYILFGGVTTCSVSLTGLREDADTLMVLATGEAEHKVEFKYYHPTTPAHFLSFLFPEQMIYRTAVDTVAAGTNEREVTIEGYGYYQDGADATSIAVNLVNLTATYIGLMQ
jgi:hypothetical protein